MKFKIKKGDQVVVVHGRDKGIKGKVIKVLRDRTSVVVEGVHQVKRHIRPSAEHPEGVINKLLPIHISNVAMVDPITGLPTKVGYKFLEDGTKVRYAKRSGEII